MTCVVQRLALRVSGCKVCDDSSQTRRMMRVAEFRTPCEFTADPVHQEGARVLNPARPLTPRVTRDGGSMAKMRTGAPHQTQIKQRGEARHMLTNDPTPFGAQATCEQRLHIFKEGQPACRHKEVRQVEELAWGVRDGVGPISENRPIRFRVLRGKASKARFKRQLEVYAQGCGENGSDVDPAYIIDALKDLCHHLHRGPVPTGAQHEDRLRIVGTVAVDVPASPLMYNYAVCPFEYAAGRALQNIDNAPGVWTDGRAREIYYY